MVSGSAELNRNGTFLISNNCCGISRQSANFTQQQQSKVNKVTRQPRWNPTYANTVARYYQI